MPDRKVIILINHYSGKRVYVETTQEKWEELTRNVKRRGAIVDGWNIRDQEKIERIVFGALPEREDFRIIETSPYEPEPILTYLIDYPSLEH